MDLNTSGMDFSLPDIATERDRIYLVNVIQERLQDYLGPLYTDVSLSKYIVVMLGNKTSRLVIEKSLAEFLGPKDAADSETTTDSHSAPYGTEHPEPTRHIRSTINLTNIGKNPRNTGLREEHHHHSRQDWYATTEQGEEERRDGTKPEKIEPAGGGGGHVWVKSGDSSNIEPNFTEEQLRSLIMRVPMNNNISTTTNRKERGNINGLPSGIQTKEITKSKQRRVRRKERQRHQHNHRHHEQSERLVVTINGKPAGSIGANHPHVERIRNATSGGRLNPNSAEFYAATPKPECSVLVKGIPWAATNSVIRAHFAAVCGTGCVPRVSILRRPISGENSNLAWVSLRNEKSAQDALGLNGSTLLLQKIHVMPKESEAARREVAKMNKESMTMYFPDPEVFNWGEEAVDRSRFKYVRGENNGVGGDVDRGVGAPMAVEVHTVSRVVKKEEGL